MSCSVVVRTIIPVSVAKPPYNYKVRLVILQNILVHIINQKGIKQTSTKCLMLMIYSSESVSSLKLVKEANKHASFMSLRV